MSSQKIHRIAMAGAFAALTCAATALLHIRSPLGGYFNMGDTLVLLSVLLLGKKWGTAAGAMGAALADVLLAYFIYAPATLLIKALTALTAAGIFGLLKKKNYFTLLLACALGEIVMAAGYFLFELFLYGLGGSWESLLLTNLPQAAVNAVAASLVYLLLEKTHLTEKIQGGSPYVK